MAQLFNSLDPSPFRERELDEDAEEHIVSWARELPVDMVLRIVIHLPQREAERAQEQGLAAAISRHFLDRAAQQQRELHELMRVGWRHLSVGLAVLVACLAGSQFARTSLGAGPLARLVEESLVILGWVANWKPIELFLYEGWPYRRRRELFLRLAAAPVDLVASAA
jgi:hypothetical protein